MAIALSAPGLANTFSGIIDALCRTVAARSAVDRSAVPMMLLIFARLRRLQARLASLAAKVEAQTPHAGPPPPRPARPADATRQPTRRTTRLPQSFAWLIRLAPGTVAYHGQVQALVTNPQTAALVAAAPQAGRILRPLCRMLAVPLPDYLRLPKPHSGPPPTGAQAADPPSQSSSSQSSPSQSSPSQSSPSQSSPAGSPARPTPAVRAARVAPPRAAAATGLPPLPD